MKPFTTALRARAWTLVELAERWGKSKRALDAIAANPARRDWDALNGLPNRNPSASATVPPVTVHITADLGEDNPDHQIITTLAGIPRTGDYLWVGNQLIDETTWIENLELIVTQIVFTDEPKIIVFAVDSDRLELKKMEN